MIYIVPFDVEGCICHFTVADTPFHIHGEDMYTHIEPGVGSSVAQWFSLVKF